MVYPPDPQTTQALTWVPMGPVRAALALAAVVLAAVVPACGRDAGPSPPPTLGGASSTSVTDDTGVSTPSTAPEPAAVVLAAGDVASCGSDGDEATAALLDDRAGEILVPGDLAYDAGSSAQFEDCYGPTWGRHRDRTHPAPGNHEYGTPAASGYFDYFGPAAGTKGEGWYSFEVGSWHVIALNSNCDLIGGCGPGSAQEAWLRADLAAHPTRCTLAFWHHPRFSSGVEHGSDARVSGLWNALFDAGADVVLNGHEHNYERFAALDAEGRPTDRGIRQFVVGTGGRSHYRLGERLPGHEAGNDTTFGVLELTLRADGYDWRFVPVEGGEFTDSGSAPCR